MCSIIKTDFNLPPARQALLFLSHTCPLPYSLCSLLSPSPFSTPTLPQLLMLCSSSVLPHSLCLPSLLLYPSPSPTLLCLLCSPLFTYLFFIPFHLLSSLPSLLCPTWPSPPLLSFSVQRLALFFPASSLPFSPVHLSYLLSPSSAGCRVPARCPLSTLIFREEPRHHLAGVCSQAGELL